MQKIFLFLIAAVFAGCQQPKHTGGEKPAANPPKAPDTTAAAGNPFANPCAGYANVYINSVEADSMKTRFVSTYRNDLETGNTRRFALNDVLDTKVINAFYTALNNGGSPALDGVRIYYGATGSAPYQSMFLLVPTRSGGTHPDMHPNVWGKKITVMGNTFKNFNYDEGPGKSLVELYSRQFREQTSPDYTTARHRGLSNGVWINKCVFDIMKTFLAAHNSTHIGFRIHAAAYAPGVTATPPGFDVPMQSTVILVPVKTDGDNDWEIMEAQYKNFKSPKQVWDDVLNHGELCPRYCP